MKLWTFESGPLALTFEAATYDEALAALVFTLGEDDASRWIFGGAR